MFDNVRERLQHELNDIREAGLWKEERVLQSPQGAEITANGQDVLCLCANNYLGLANDPELTQAAKTSIDESGLGMASVRFICGTQAPHKPSSRRSARSSASRTRSSTRPAGTPTAACSRS